MTSLTGSTKLTEPVPPPVPFPVALGGAALQLTAVVSSWAFCTTAGPCLADPWSCLAGEFICMHWKYPWVRQRPAAKGDESPELTPCSPRTADPASADPWGRQVLGTIVIGLCTWVISVILGLAHGGQTSDPSLVDRMWSVLPCLYVWHLLLSAPTALAKPRLLAMAVRCHPFSAPTAPVYTRDTTEEHQSLLSSCFRLSGACV